MCALLDIPTWEVTPSSLALDHKIPLRVQCYMKFLYHKEKCSLNRSRGQSLTDVKIHEQQNVSFLGKEASFVVVVVFKSCIVNKRLHFKGIAGAFVMKMEAL